MTQLPKNFRQVGEPKLNKRIYIEDYVMTYLTELAQPENIYARGAILLGTIKDTKEGQAIFIKGAMEAQNLELDLDETIFSNEVWAEIKERRKKYFPNLEIIGWFLSRIGFSVELNDKILRTHMENFAGENKVLYMMDTLEREDAFYFWEKGELKKSDGYYIYYEKNEQMQEYMIIYGEDSRQKTTENKETPIIKRDEDVIKSYRNLIKNKKKQKKNKKVLGKIYTAMGSCAVLVAILGFLLFSYGEKKEESAMANISDIIQGQSNTVEETWSEKEDNGEGEKEASKLLGTKESSADTTESSINLEQETSKSENDIIDEEEGSSENEMDTTKNQENNSVDGEKLEQSSSNIQEDKNKLEEGTGETEETMGVAGSYYTVQPGDTLAAISNRVYESIEYVEDIAELNKLSDQNKIYPGQKLQLPPKD
ncbi:MAG: LysM peptidoglycan-binding domain-containing protein [Lachnospiraceae bacterium]